MRGDVRIVLPNLTFDRELCFNEEGGLFFHSPGHSADSSSCYDMLENILYVGDNMGDPRAGLYRSRRP